MPALKQLTSSVYGIISSRDARLLGFEKETTNFVRERALPLFVQHLPFVSCMWVISYKITEIGRCSPLILSHVLSQNSTVTRNFCRRIPWTACSMCLTHTSWAKLSHRLQDYSPAFHSWYQPHTGFPYKALQPSHIRPHTPECCSCIRISPNGSFLIPNKCIRSIHWLIIWNVQCRSASKDTLKIPYFGLILVFTSHRLRLVYSGHETINTPKPLSHAMLCALWMRKPQNRMNKRG